MQFFFQFSKVYGPVYSIYLGFTPAVVIQGFKDLKEILVNKGIDFADRPQNRLIEAINGTRGNVIIFFISCEYFDLITDQFGHKNYTELTW